MIDRRALLLSFAGSMMAPRVVRADQPSSSLPRSQKFLIGSEVPGQFSHSVTAHFFTAYAGHSFEKLAVVMPGRNGHTQAPHMTPIIDALLAQGFSVISVDPHHSEKPAEKSKTHDFTMTAHIDDLRRALMWVFANKTQIGWRGETLFLSGHSMGGYAALSLAATEFKGRIRHVLAVNPVIRGQNQIDRFTNPEHLKNYLAEVPSALRDYPRHDMYHHVGSLDVPVSIVTAEQDTVTPPQPLRQFFKALPVPSDLSILPGEGHCMISPAYREALTKAIKVSPGYYPVYASHLDYK
ncbi:MAG: alpha/beta fold hydrolase [Alphaproteobacteria bacterium]|nr:alpha/beta fold hydrolase [Alphaproteobacteria bacterium]